MSSRFKHILVSAALLLLCGCGFHAMYGDESAGSHSAVRGNIFIDPLTGREGQIFKNALEDKFNPESLNTKDAPYHLHITFSKLLIPSVVKSDGTIQRYNVRFDSQFKLYKSDNLTKPIFSGNLRRSGSYNAAVNANFASYEAEQDVIERTLQEMAEDYVMRIAGYMEAMPDDTKAATTPVTSPAAKP